MIARLLLYLQLRFVVPISDHAGPFNAAFKACLLAFNIVGPL